MVDPWRMGDYPGTVLIQLAMANKGGGIQPIKRSATGPVENILFHTDAVQVVTAGEGK